MRDQTQELFDLLLDSMPSFRLPHQEGKFDPHGIALSPSGELFVADEERKKIRVFDQNGTLPLSILFPKQSSSHD